MKIKTHLKSLLYVFVFSVILVTTYKVYAGTTDTVSATVTAQIISVTLSGSDPIAFGVVAPSGSQNTGALGLGTAPDYTITATNDGSVTENFHIQATDSASWAFANDPGSESYSMGYCITSCDVADPTFNVVGDQSESAYVEFATGIAKDATQPFDLEIETPTSTVAVVQQSITVTVMATAN